VRAIGLAAVLFLVAVSAGYGSSASAAKASAPAVISAGEGYLGQVSCGAVGNCAVGGSHLLGYRHEAFVVTEKRGSWGKAIEVPGTATLNSGGDAGVGPMSCSAAGECAAGGEYAVSSYGSQAFVVSETNGRWGTAIEMPGTAALTAHESYLTSISCAAPGECAAGGFYDDGSGDARAFVVSETNGRWGKAIEVPGMATLSGGEAIVYSISCGAVGDCAAGGFYVGLSGVSHAFVVNETNGSWGKAFEVPGTAALDTGGVEIVVSISCAAAGECAADGEYADRPYGRQAFVVSETNGSWGTAVELPGMETLNTGHHAYLGSISCAAPGECALGGTYFGANPGVGFEAFVASETNGSWGTAMEVPGTAMLNTGGGATADSTSCSAPGDCAAGGFYSNGAGNDYAFVVGETNGSWGGAITVRGFPKAEGAQSGVGSISCAAPRSCAAGAWYEDRSGRLRPYVVSEVNGSWGQAIQVRFPRCVVPWVYGETIGAATTMLTDGHCGLEKITKVYADWKKGLVLAQYPRPGTTGPFGSPVALTVSKGAKP
jgi:PASTA domain-containing protein